jgi:hypothetical protein
MSLSVVSPLNFERESGHIYTRELDIFDYNDTLSGAGTALNM